VLFSLVILRMLPDCPAQAKWLTAEETAWLQRQLDADGAQAHLGHQAGVLKALLSPQVWMIGIFFFCALTCSYGYGFSAPAILQAATGWNVSQVGYLVAALGVAGAVAMLWNGAHSDRSGERRLHCIVPCVVMAAGYLAASLATEWWLVVASLGASFIAFNALLGPAVSVPTEFMAGRAAAAGIAAMNTITMFSGFVGPYWMGVVKDATGSYQLGVRGLLIPALAAAGVMHLLTRSLARRKVALAVGRANLADETA
jgi:ACS family tartrate transporter-like MFS transporter